VICDNKGNIIDSFNERIKTTHTIAPDASKVRGIYAKDLKNCRRESEVLTDFCV
jgi:DNA polymerase III alpha subunit (gram-positive type)